MLYPDSNLLDFSGVSGLHLLLSSRPHPSVCVSSMPRHTLQQSSQTFSCRSSVSSGYPQLSLCNPAHRWQIDLRSSSFAMLPRLALEPLWQVLLFLAPKPHAVACPVSAMQSSSFYVAFFAYADRPWKRPCTDALLEAEPQSARMELPSST